MKVDTDPEEVLGDEEVQELPISDFYRALDRPRRLHVRYCCNEAHVSEMRQTLTIARREKEVWM